jgi:transcriptional regulator with XRE-family HTH domain
MSDAATVSNREPFAAGIVRRERKRLGLTQAQLAERIGASQSDVSRLEVGSRSLSLREAERLAEVFVVPLQAFLTGDVRPGTRLADLASELRSLGMVDLLVPEARVPGAFRPAEEVVAWAVSGERPDPRVIEALPAVLAWNRWRVGLLDAFARATHPRAVTRLAWLAEATLILERNDGFPGGLVSGDDLTAFLDGVTRPDEADDLGHPGEGEPAHRVWKYWRVNYAADLTTFRNRAAQLWALRSARPGSA